MVSSRGGGGAEPVTLDGDGLSPRLESGHGFQGYADAVVETIRESLVVLDENLRVRFANRAFFETFQVTPEETEGRYVGELGNGQWDIQRLRFLLESLRSSIEEFKNFEVDHFFPNIGRRTMLLNARRLIADGSAHILLATSFSPLKTPLNASAWRKTSGKAKNAFASWRKTSKSPSG
jgi:two-component system, chemotaxis family, CheB/CheR fusion protein